MGALSIDSARVDLMRRHPAVLFTTVVHLPHIDVRQVANSLRHTIIDSNIQLLLPAGNSSSMVAVGFGANLAVTVEQLRSIDGASTTAGVEVSHELIRLKNASATNVAALVHRALLTSRELRHPSENASIPAKDRPWKLSVLADERLNALVVTCRSEDVPEVRALIAQLDVE